MRIVMVIDDDILERATLVRELHKLPAAEVIGAGTLRGGMDLLDAFDVDLVICSAQLPEGGAWTLIEKLGRGGRRLPVLLLGSPDPQAPHVLPDEVERLPRPIEPAAVRDWVCARLGSECAAGPFSVTDYLQLAGMGQHSVRLELSSDGEEIGAIVVNEGQAWSAEDPLGEGVDAFMRLLARTDISVTCAPLGDTLPRRSLEGSCGQLLMRALTRIDELRSGHIPEAIPEAIPEGGAGFDDGFDDGFETGFDDDAGSRPNLARGSGQFERIALGDEFDRLYELGLEAMLRKRYRDALDVLERARQIRTTTTLEANLKRLRALGAS